MFSKFEETDNYLESLIPTHQKTVGAMRLERISYLLKLLGNPHQRLKFVHIGGTSGKGSVAYFLTHLLAGQGYEVGLHISPHLQIVTERMQINGQSISKKRFIDYVNSFRPLINQVEKDLGFGKPTYFETLVALSLDYFAKEKVDIAVVEVGLGGTLDATNLIKPLLSIITNVGLDHTEILGKTVQKIAGDKAGIIKPHAPVITGVKQPSVQKIIADKAAICNSKLFLLGKNFGYKIKTATLSGNIFDFIWEGETYLDFKLSIPGMFQVENASLALAAINLLGGRGFEIGKEKLYQSLATAKIPGRFEVVQKNPLIILDGAHNPTKIKTFLFSLTKVLPNKKFIFMVTFKKDKDIGKMLNQLARYAKAFVLTEFSRVTDVGRRFATPATNLAQSLKGLNFSGKIIAEENSSAAFDQAKKLAGEDEIIVVIGSLYLVGEIRDLFFPIK